MSEFFSGKYKAGYSGSDSQREKAERMFGPEVKGLNMDVPQSHSSKAQQKMRLYAEGGHAEGGPAMRRGGRRRAEGGKMAMGGELRSHLAHMQPAAYEAEGGKMRRGGHGRKRHFLTGGVLPVVDGIASMFGLKEGGEAKRRGGHTGQHRHHHKMPDYQTNEHFPRRGKTPKLNQERFQDVSHMAEGGKSECHGGAMRRGGHKRHFGAGGEIIAHGLGIPGLGSLLPFAEGGEAKRRGGHARRAEGGRMATGGAEKAEGGKMRRGGHKGHYDFGGMIGDALMPRMPHRADGGKMADGGKYARGGNVYEREMVGEHPSHSRPHFNYESDMRGERCVKRSYADGGKMAMGGVGKIRHGQATRAGRPINRRVDRDMTRY